MPREIEEGLSSLSSEASRKRLGKGLEKILALLTKRDTEVPEACDRLLELVDTVVELETPEEEPWPSPPNEAAFCGPLGELAKLIEPHSEADPVAILAQGLVAFGSAVGPGPYFRVEADRHHANEFLLIVGKTARGRKGTSRGHVMARMKEVDPEWFEHCIKTGLASGEGLIHALREEAASSSPKDKRLLVEESEFARVLAAGAREGNILTSVLRQAWDSQTLSNLTKRDPLEARGCHISVNAHVTEAELLRLMQNVDALNGYLNRFFFLRVRRTKLLPLPSRIPEEPLLAITNALRESLEKVRSLGEIRFTTEAEAEWVRVYPEISRDDRQGLLDPLAARAEPHVLRLSLLYALSCGSGEIAIEHLRAGLALWDYAERSLEGLFGDRLEDPLADKVLAHLRAAGHSGMNREQLHRKLGNRTKGAALRRALDLLEKQRLIRVDTAGKGARYVARPRRSTKREG